MKTLLTRSLIHCSVKSPGSPSPLKELPGGGRLLFLLFTLKKMRETSIQFNSLRSSINTLSSSLLLPFCAFLLLVKNDLH